MPHAPQVLWVGVASCTDVSLGISVPSAVFSFELDFTVQVKANAALPHVKGVEVTRFGVRTPDADSETRHQIL